MVTELDPAAVPGELRERRLDVGLLHDYDVAPVEPDPAIDAVSLLDETVYLAGPPSCVAAPNPIQAARDLPWIVGTPGTLCHTVAMRVCRAAAFTPRVRHHADDFTTVLALVAAGQGVALVPQLAAADPPPGVRRLPVAIQRRTRIAYRKGSATHPAVAASISAIRRSTRAYLGAAPGH